MQHGVGVVNYRPRVQQMTQQVLARPPRDWQAASTALSHSHPATSADGCESASAGLSPNAISNRSHQERPSSARLEATRAPVGEFLLCVATSAAMLACWRVEGFELTK